MTIEAGIGSVASTPMTKTRGRDCGANSAASITMAPTR